MINRGRYMTNLDRELWLLSVRVGLGGIGLFGTKEKKGIQ